MAIRMQQRRGTASQWTSSNPILNAGEIGFESDTNKFKIGDGTNHWGDLNYFIDADTLIDGAPGLLDTLNELAAALGDDPSFFSTVATNLSNHSADTTSVHGITDTAELATKTFAAELLTNATKSNITITGNKDGLTITAENGVADSNTDNLTEGSTNKYFTDERAQDAVGNAVGTGLSYDDSTGAISVNTTTIQARVADVSDTEIGYLNGVTSAIQTQIDGKQDVVSGVSSTEIGYLDGVTSAIQTQIDAKAPLASPTFTGTATTNHLIVDGDFTVNGTNFAASATSITIEDNLVQIAHNNPANTVDLGLVVGYNDGTAKHAGLVKDTSANTWKLFKGVTTEPATTVDFTEGSLDDLAVAGLTASSLTVGDVSNTEFGYLNGVTSAIQTQIDGKSPTAGNTSLVTLGTVTTGTWSADTIAINKGGTGATTAMEAATALLPSQTSNSGKYLTNDGAGTLSWATVEGYSAPTLGSTSVASGATVTTIAGLTLSGATLTGSLTAGGATGTSGQVLASTGSGVQWTTPAQGAAFSELMLVGC